MNATDGPTQEHVGERRGARVHRGRDGRQDTACADVPGGEDPPWRVALRRTRPNRGETAAGTSIAVASTPAAVTPPRAYAKTSIASQVLHSATLNVA